MQTKDELCLVLTLYIKKTQGTGGLLLKSHHFITIGSSLPVVHGPRVCLNSLSLKIILS